MCAAASPPANEHVLCGFTRGLGTRDSQTSLCEGMAHSVSACLCYRMLGAPLSSRKSAFAHVAGGHLRLVKE